MPRHAWLKCLWFGSAVVVAGSFRICIAVLLSVIHAFCCLYDIVFAAILLSVTTTMLVLSLASSDALLSDYVKSFTREMMPNYVHRPDSAVSNKN